jgi:glucose-1-phosphate thymidylyltransferase
MEEWIGLIPAAGKGLRLGLPYPKELYPVIRNNRYKPVSQFILDNMVTAGVSHLVFVINETKHQLIAYFGNGQRFGCDITYVVQESLEQQENSTSPGLAHALDSAYHLTYGKTVFFGMADTIIQPKSIFKNALEQAAPGDDAILCLFSTEHPEKVGIVQREGAYISKIIDKPKQTNLTEMWGCMIWKPKFTEFLHVSIKKGIMDFARIMNMAIDSGLKFKGIYSENSSYLDLGTYQEIIELDKHFRLD